MGTGELLYGVAAGLISLGLLALLLIATELGFRIGSRDTDRNDETVKSQEGSLQAGMLALLGLLLAFTFSMASTRFDARKLLVLEESNAIGTAYLRARLLADADRRKIEGLLKRYVDARLDYYRADIDEEAAMPAAREVERIQDEFWSHAAAIGLRQPDSVTIGLLLRSLNEVIDLQSKQTVAFENHVPEVILLVEFFVAAVTMWSVGHRNGLGKRRQFLFTALVSIILAMTIFLILDLDRPGRGVIQVGQKTLLNLRDRLNAEDLRQPAKLE